MKTSKKQAPTRVRTISSPFQLSYKHTNDQPAFDDNRKFLYADDLCFATQATSFGTIEQKLTSALNEMIRYNEQWSLNANFRKAKRYVFHSKNYTANKKLNIISNARALEHKNNVTLS